MKKNRFLAPTLIAIAILSGCNSIPQNASLADAHASYNSALINSQVTNMAALELKDAEVSLNKADIALRKGESAATVNQLAYIAKQKVMIAQETAKQKIAELAVTNAAAKRDQIRLEARTAEADAAKEQVAIAQEQTVIALEEAAIVREVANQQVVELVAASVNSERDQALIAQQEVQLQELNAQKLNAQKTERGLVITLGDVLFSTNNSQLASGGLRNVQKLADFLAQYPQRKVLVEGHTDNTGSMSLNKELSDRRANAVRTALLDMGVSAERIATRGYGEAFPVTSNDTATSRQLNRRVEIVISDDSGNVATR